MAGLRSNAEHISNLPFFGVTPSEDFPGWLIVRCPREDCPSRATGKAFIVHAETWKAPLMSSIKPEVELIGRACPYCYATSRFPRAGRKQRR